MSSNREAELDRYPKYKDHYLRAFKRMLEERDRRGKTGAVYFTSPEGVMDWYLEKTTPKLKPLDGQIALEDVEQEGWR